MERRRRDFLTAAGAFAAGAVAADLTVAAAERRGTELLHGSGSPSRFSGIVGDFYIDDVAHRIYGPKRSSGWGQPFNLFGPAGSPGRRMTSLERERVYLTRVRAEDRWLTRDVTTPTLSGQASGSAPRTPSSPVAGASTRPGGYLVLHGEGPPLASLGVDNDFYIDTTSTQLYGPKEGGVWGSPVPLTGSFTATDIDGGTL